ncbi:DUF4148 domain-containing protein [Paraburkholderia sp. MM5384-R2]|uniref:DUF4148 domain-containing protein n=1 Tax=Paraburkholderia sp. MM5384-R2 TaxID=2723097 RepID=UPI0016172B82|nr:DUF4148 domain-containing protein [Paraburkholderia sp. MM5384-R2]
MIVLMGLVFGAVTIGAYVSQMDNDWSSGRDVSLVADGERGVSATAAAGQSEGRPGAATVAPATRRHALRDDVTALRAQPAASIGAQAGDALAIAALQFARESNKAQQQQQQLPRPQPQQTSLPPQPAVTSNRTQAPPTAKTGHAHHSRVASGTTTKPRSAQSVATTSGSHARGGSHRKSSTAERSGKKAASVVPEARPLPQYATQGVESPWSMPRAGLTSPSATQAVASNGPKTRAEVEAELVRARENGTMPAFGRPEPSGPGAH